MEPSWATLAFNVFIAVLNISTTAPNEVFIIIMFRAYEIAQICFLFMKELQSFEVIFKTNIWLYMVE
jgi:hypothetical protein